MTLRAHGAGIRACDAFHVSAILVLPSALLQSGEKYFYFSTSTSISISYRSEGIVLRQKR